MLAVFPADHFIEDLDGFAARCQLASAAAETGHIATLGIRPTRPETGYGYIRASSEAGADGDAVLPVEEFVEKPDRATAESYLAAGN